MQNENSESRTTETCPGDGQPCYEARDPDEAHWRCGTVQCGKSQTTEGTHIRFVSLGIRDGQKTERWHVETKEDEDCLGEVKWFGRWRRYSFFPEPGCVFEQTCMREISDFIEERTRERR